jgi:transcription elongation GreA/GreB family factor
MNEKLRQALERLWQAERMLETARRQDARASAVHRETSGEVEHADHECKTARELLRILAQESVDEAEIASPEERLVR